MEEKTIKLIIANYEDFETLAEQIGDQVLKIRNPKSRVRFDEICEIHGDEIILGDYPPIVGMGLLKLGHGKLS